MIPPVGLKAIVLSSTTIHLTWTDTTLPRNQQVTDNRIYTVRYGPRIAKDRKHKYVNTTDLNLHVEDLKPNTEYEFSVKITKGRRGSSYSMTVSNTTSEDCKCCSLIFFISCCVVLYFIFFWTSCSRIHIPIKFAILTTTVYVCVPKYSFCKNELLYF